MRRILVTALIAPIALLVSSGCQQMRKHVGPLHGIDVELGLRSALGDNEIEGTSIDGQGRGLGHSSTVFSGESYSRFIIDSKVVFRFRPE